MEQWVIPLILLVIGYSVGTILEKRHFRSIREREELLMGLPAVSLKMKEEYSNYQKAEMVYGSVVVSTDYFKMIAASLKGLFGGRIGVYETLLDRGRREAILRMKEMAKGYDLIVNMRVDTSSISKNSGRKNSIGSIEVFAYGTALKRKADEV